MFTITKSIEDFANSFKYSWPSKEFIKQHYKALAKKYPKLTPKTKVPTICGEMMPHIIYWLFKEYNINGDYSTLEDKIAKELENKKIIIRYDNSLIDLNYPLVDVIPTVKILKGKEEKRKIPLLLFIEETPVMVFPRYGKHTLIWDYKGIQKYRELKEFIETHWKKEPSLIIAVDKNSYESLGGKSTNNYLNMGGKVRLLYKNFGVIVTHFSKKRTDFYNDCKQCFENTTEAYKNRKI